MRGQVFTALLWGLALLGAAGAVFRLLPHPRPPMEEVEFTFSLGSIPEALAKGAASLLGEGRAAGKECRVTEVGTVPVLRPRGYGGAPRSLPSATALECHGRGRIAGLFREGSFFAGGEIYFAPGARVWIENENACFFVQILSISKIN